jgi:uncharacterized protein YndB with AHSA1/START domain
MKPNEFSITRVYNAPVKIVWEAWTDLNQITQWWGPRGFTITTVSKDLRPGGCWIYTMHGPNGIDYPNKAVYHEVQHLSLLVYDHGGNDNQPPLFRVTAKFSEHNGKTTFQMTMACDTEEKAIQIQKHIKIANGNTTWDRLGEFLENKINGKEKFFISRSFDTDIENMFELWTNPTHIQKWLSPTGTEMKYFRSDIRNGGSAFYSMYSNDFKLFGTCTYLEISRPTQLIYTQQFCDETEKTIRHPMAPTWPETMKTIITFATENGGKTRVTIEWEPYGNVNPTELKTFTDGRSGMTMGWTGSFDKLENFISENKKFGKQK